MNRLPTAAIATLAGLLALVPAIASAAPKPAPAKKRAPKVAVLILKTGAVSEELADNLTEVLLTSLATGKTFRIVGKEVIKTRLGGEEKRVLNCVGNRTCVGNVATALGLDYLVVGTLGKRDEQFVYNLVFLDAASATEKKLLHRKVSGGIRELTRSLAASLIELLKPKVKPGELRVSANIPGAVIHIDKRFAGSVPLVRPGLEKGTLLIRIEAKGYRSQSKRVTIQPGKVAVVRFELVKLPPIIPRTKTWKFHLAWASLGLSLATFAGAGVTGGLSRRRSGSTLNEVLADLDRRRKLALATNALIGVGAAWAVMSTALFIFGRKDFYRGGERPAQESSPKVQVRVLPLASGAFVQGEARW